MGDQERIGGVERRLEDALLQTELLAQRAAALQQGVAQAWGYAGGIGVLPSQGALSVTVSTLGCRGLPLTDVPITCVTTGVTVTPALGEDSITFSISYTVSEESQTIALEFSADPTGIYARFQVTTIVVDVTIPATRDTASFSTGLALTPTTGYHCCSLCAQPLLPTLYALDAVLGGGTPATLAWLSENDWYDCEVVPYTYPGGFTPATSSVALGYRFGNTSFLSPTGLFVAFNYVGGPVGGLYYPAPGTTCPIQALGNYGPGIPMATVAAPSAPGLSADGGFRFTFAGTAIGSGLYQGATDSPLITLKEVNSFP